jgi:leader peptidase (prepilin peptidase) / N-methyltransferase
MTDTTVRLVRDVVFLVFGLAMGSFLTVVIYRVPRGESIVTPSSACPKCGASIGPSENIPVISYLVLRGRCRRCGNPISAEYPITEAVTAALFVGASLRFASFWQAALMAPFFGVMLACAVIDARHRIIPNRVVYPSLVGFAIAILAAWLAGLPLSAPGAGIGLLAYGGVLGLIALVAPGGMGMGDAKLTALIGLVLGALGLRYVAVAAALGFIGGGVGGIVSLAVGKSRKDAIPFGPYLAAGAVASAFVGPAVAGWYAGLLGQSALPPSKG